MPTIWCDPSCPPSFHWLPLLAVKSRCQGLCLNPPEATRRLDPLKLRQVEVADRSQRVRRRAVGKARRQRIEPRLIVALQLHQLGHRVAPTLRVAASVARLLVADLGRSVRMGRPKSRLPLRGVIVTPWHCLPFIPLHNAL